MKFFYKLLGGRPMRLLTKNSIFYDPIGNVPVGYYQDKIGRVWMGNMQSRLGGWQFGRVRIESQLIRHLYGDSGE